MKFFRIVNTQFVAAEDCDMLGWPLHGDHYVIPDESFEKKRFLVYRTAFGVGDWGIIAAMPRMLKEAYPDATVCIPSPHMLFNTFGPSNRHGNWMNAYDIPAQLFMNNPYVDKMVDTWDDEIYHDHFRVYENLDNDPVVLQMLRFHKVDVSTNTNYLPEIYFSEREVDEYEKVKRQYFGTEPYVAFSARRSYAELKEANRSEDIANKLFGRLHEIADDYRQYQAMVYNGTEFDFNLQMKMSMDNIPLRRLLYLLSGAHAVVGQQTGIFDTCCRYTKVDVVPHSNHIAENYLHAVNYRFI